jgi:hypothetical protein
MKKELNEMNKSELRDLLRRSKREFKKLLTEHEALLCWQVFYDMTDEGLRIIKILHSKGNKGITKSDAEQERLWWNARSKAEKHMEDVLNWEV